MYKQLKYRIKLFISILISIIYRIYIIFLFNIQLYRLQMFAIFYKQMCLRLLQMYVTNIYHLHFHL